MQPPKFIIVLMMVSGSTASHWMIKPEIGIPAGYIPDCPGVLKNDSISARTMPKVQIVLHRLKADEVERRSMPLASAASMVAKENLVDFGQKKTVVYAVGFFDSANWPHSQALGAAYARRGYNVFVTETFQLLTYIYPKSVRLARVIGKKLGEFLVKLVKQGLKAEKLELVGISLGAHISSYAAKHFYEVTGTKVSRLTGLDPAGPCFRALPSEERFNANAAVRVDVLHTNIDGFGIAEPLGHIDYYVNGGEFQPSDIPYIPCLVICSHVKSFVYWWLAIANPKKYIGMTCNSVQEARYANCYNSTVTNYVGLETDFSKPGIYYLPTSNKFPYFMGKDGLKESNEVSTAFLTNLNSDNGFEV